MDIQVDLDLSRYSLSEVVMLRHEGVISIAEFNKELSKRNVEIPAEVGNSYDS